MRNLITIFVFSMFFGLTGFSQNANSFFLLEKAGKQRMLCEQMSKDYLMLLSNVKVAQAKSEIEKSKVEFNENVNFLYKNLTSDLTLASIASISDKWLDFKDKINAKPTKTEAIVFLKLSDELSILCNDLIAKVYAENDFKNARMLNLCNKQKLNSQKIAKLGLIYALKISDNQIVLDEMNKTISSYEFSASLLKNLTSGNDSLTNILKTNLDDWMFVKNNFNLENPNFKINSIIDNTDSILKDNISFSDLVQKISLSENALTKL